MEKKTPKQLFEEALAKFKAEHGKLYEAVGPVLEALMAEPEASELADPYSVKV